MRDGSAGEVATAETLTPITGQTGLGELFDRHWWERVSDWLVRILTVGWTATMLVLTVARLVGLVGDLLARYW
jgi:hypothetical protein